MTSQMRVGGPRRSANDGGKYTDDQQHADELTEVPHLGT